MREYTLKRLRGDGYDFARVIDAAPIDAAEAVVADIRLTLGCETREIRQLRRSLDAHLSTPGATLSNYQW